MKENGKEVPQAVKGWNWGAFMYSIFWGIGNKTYLPLLTLIPIFNIVWVFVVGFKGNEWAWQKGDYQDVETFKAVQATWNRAGLVQFIVAIVIFVLYMFVFASLVTSLINGNH
ncbi:ribonuclease G (plasmid) [Lactiplantibacillus plantarum]|uniref:ribonuclease G n=2 Tax=Lactobacillaceae TaxID=33958 RepID=UPI0020103854|nr:ribonuclease G [Lactiplantibacillus plantarum]UQB62641.1 ribonuclease G [Lactiplantibacillus plantarum]